MIKSKNELKEYLQTEFYSQFPNSIKWKLINTFIQYPNYVISRYIYYLRKQEYYINTANESKIRGAVGLYYERKKNLLGQKIGIEIGPNCIDKGLTIYHGSIVINSEAKIGEGCKLHGANCIGNNGKDQGAPRIGNNVDVGYGAAIIGDIEIADNVVIGANAVVNKSIYKPGSVVAGIPAREIIHA